MALITLSAVLLLLCQGLPSVHVLTHLCTCHSLTCLPPHLSAYSYGFVVFQDPAVTDIAIAGLHGLKMGDRTLTVRRAAEVRLQSALWSIGDRQAIGLDVRPYRHTCTCYTYTAGHAFAVC